jgi:hypothetical protein
MSSRPPVAARGWRVSYSRQASAAASIAARVLADTGWSCRIAWSAAVKSSKGSVCWSRSIVHTQADREPVFAHSRTNASTLDRLYG